MNNDVAIDRRTLLEGASTALALAASGTGALAASAETKIQQPSYRPKDRFFGPAFIDVDETRNSPIPHRYIHGGFHDTDTRFSFYFPSADKFKGRFFHTLEGGLGGNENSVAGSSPQGVVPVSSLAPLFELGGYLVESNQGHIGADLSGVKGDSTILTYRASAESAKFGKFLAKQIYGSEPQNGYIFGGSGGGIRSLMCLEHTSGVWQGGVPFIIPHPDQGMFFSMQANAIRLLGQDNIARIADAVAVGGSERPFDGLTADQAEALARIYKAGFPRGVTLKDAFEAVLVWAWNSYQIEIDDPTYFTDFYSKPGYVGHDNPDSLKPWRVEHRTRVRRVLTASELLAYKPQVTTIDQLGIGEQSRIFSTRRGQPEAKVAVILEDGDLGMMGCAQLNFQSGAARNRDMYVLGVTGEALVTNGVGNNLLEGVQPGDEVLVDNSRYLAYCHRWMHQVQPEFLEWSPSVVDKQSIYPQRPRKNVVWAGDYTFDLTGKKIIIVNGMQDRGTWPSSPVAYRAHLEDKMGVNAEDVTRIWFNQQQQHIDGSWMVPVGAPVPTTEFIDYGGSIHEALRQVVAWVENGKAPEPSSNFQYTRDSQVVLEQGAARRGGVQPVITVKGNGSERRVEVKAGQPVEFVAVAESTGGGPIVSLEWDFEGMGTWPAKMAGIPKGARRVEHRTSHTFAKSGTYFASCRIASQFAGSQSSPYYRLNNLGRMRVIVT